MNEFEFDDILYTILKGIISGFLIAYLIILGLRPSAEYPDNIIEVIDNPWIFVVLILINFYAMQWDLTIGLLLLLSIIALLLDVIIFTEGAVFNSDINIEQFKEKEDLKDDNDEEDDDEDDDKKEDKKEVKNNVKNKVKNNVKNNVKNKVKNKVKSLMELLGDDNFTNNVVNLVSTIINTKEFNNE
tara:strand:- start:698 stop:1255 length:558 start_codon:yes stop_codon:yes gene_type:complete